MRKPYPNRNNKRDILSRIKIRGPLVQVEPLRAHKVWNISKDKVTILCRFKNEDIVTVTNKMISDAIRN